MTILIVDWLGRGGIAQVTETWAAAARDAGREVHVVSRLTPHIAADSWVGRVGPTPIGALRTHRDLVEAAVRAVLDIRPAVVYIQNYLLPAIERQLLEAGRAVGATTVLAVHNAHPHSRLAGSQLGLRGLIRSADTVVVHSGHVANQVATRFGRRSVAIEHPLPVALLHAEPAVLDDVRALQGSPIAATFGVLKRRYKGAGLVQDLAPHLPDGWRMVAAGVGARPLAGARTCTVDRFLSAGELRWLLERATTTVLPYRAASQSGAVVLAQALGAPPIVSAVGAIPEQVTNGETGLLVDPASGVEAWTNAIRRVAAEPAWWDQVRARARREVESRHERAVATWLSLLR